MNKPEALRELDEVLKSCALLMPREWRERHLKDAKEAVETLRDVQREEEVNAAKRWFIDEIRSCQAGISGGYADEELMKGQIKIYTIALEGLGRL